MSTNSEHFDVSRINAIPITGVAQRLGYELKRAGSVYKCLCPWHEDRHPSLTLYERTDENRCHCFSCGQGGSVIDLVMQHNRWDFQQACRWLSDEYCIPTGRSHWPSALHRPKPVPKPPQQEFTYIPQEMLEELISSESSLCQCLVRMFQPEAVECLAEEYQLGCYSMNGQDDYTVFPSIDVQGRICNLKLQHYDTDPLSPRYGHSDGSCFWLGSMWTKEGRFPAGSVFRSDCLFGCHLVPRYPAQKVALVESPKNALFGALQMPQYLWVATGNKGSLKREVLLPLQGRDVIVIPDCDAVDEWSKTIGTMADIANFTVSDFCRRKAPADQPKFDIADYIAQQRQASPF